MSTPTCATPHLDGIRIGIPIAVENESYPRRHVDHKRSLETHDTVRAADDFSNGELHRYCGSVWNYSQLAFF